MNDAIYKERFDNLLRVLYTVRDTKETYEFDLSTWHYEEDCLTSACAIGWCCLDAWFKDEGFQFITVQITDFWRPRAPSYSGKKEWEAVQEFFNIDYETAGALFRDCFYEQDPVRAGDVIERVEEFVKTHFGE